MPLINCKVNLILTWSANCVIVSTNFADQGVKFTLTERKIYVPAVTLSTQDNAKLLPQFKSGFKRTINWDKYLAKTEFLPQNPNLSHLVELSFQGINRLFVLAFENDIHRTSSKRYNLPGIKIKDYNVIFDGKNIFDQPIKNNKTTYHNVRRIATGQGDDYTTDCLLDYAKLLQNDCNRSE